MIVDWPIYYDPIKAFVELRKPIKGLEIGFAWGMSANAFLLGCDGTLISVDLSDHLGRGDQVRTDYGNRWKLLNGKSEDIVPMLTDKFDWIYLDGDHGYKAVREDIKNCLPLLTKGGVLVLDDYGREPGVKQAADETGLSFRSVVDHPNGAVYYEN